MNYRKLCTAVGLKEEMVDYLRQMFSGLSEDDATMMFDIEGAIYWFAADYHQGKSSELYSILSTSEYRPGPMEYSPSDKVSYDYSTLKDMYHALEERFGGGSTLVDNGEQMYRSLEEDRSQNGE
jgi:hypothetical protein